MYIGLVSRLVRKGEVLFYSSVYINNGTKNFEVKVDVQKGALRFRGKFDKRYVRFIHFTISCIVFI